MLVLRTITDGETQTMGHHNGLVDLGVWLVTDAANCQGSSNICWGGLYLFPLIQWGNPCTASALRAQCTAHYF